MFGEKQPDVSYDGLLKTPHLPNRQRGFVQGKRARATFYSLLREEKYTQNLRDSLPSLL